MQTQTSCTNPSVMMYDNIQVMGACTFMEVSGKRVYYKRTCEHVTSKNGEQTVKQIQAGLTEYSDSGCTNQLTGTIYTHHDAECSSVGAQWECEDYDLEGGTSGPFTDSYMTYSNSIEKDCTLMGFSTMFNMYPTECVELNENESQKYEYVNGNGLTWNTYNNADCKGSPLFSQVPFGLEGVPMDECKYLDNKYTYLNDSPAETLLQVDASSLGDLATPPTEPSPTEKTITKSKNGTGVSVGACAGGAVGVFALLAMYYYFVYAPAQRKLTIDAAVTPSGADMEAQNSGTANPIHK